MREIALSGSSVGHRNCERRVGAEGSGERGQGEAGEEELSAGLPAAEQPLLPVLTTTTTTTTKQAAAAAPGRRGEEEELCLSVKL